MKRLWLVALLLSLCTVHAFCDGPPMDSLGYPTAESYYITLTQQQIKQVGRTRVLTLTKQQWKILHSPRFPRTIDVVTRSYNDCTCDLVYCIWFKENKVAIPKYDVDTTNEPNELYDGYKAIPFRYICIDHNCLLFYDGKAMSSSDIDAQIEDMKQYIDGGICITLPPKLGKTREDKLQKSINTLRKKCVDAHIKLYIM